MDGGIYPAPDEWLRALRAATAARGILLVCDEIQAGCGRTGDFFGFTRSGITPDLVTLSKSLGGAGLPISVLLVRPELDVWAPGEHTGTFRGNQLAFVAGAAALRLWSDPAFRADLAARSARLAAFAAELDQPTRVRGMALGVDTGDARRAEEVQAACFADGLVLETCGRADAVLKVTPPLTIAADELDRGLTVLAKALR
ncbi:aminotransferase class III-fold pyridoxal phosphate-dependent enzyme [Actinokineospora soli]|uniref:Diaminobutyrate--2-oxoglutarate transaminase n=1 Tax=Actinokineospora soli TaxID=1048753 RepID=A0ABW2TQI2_9PSEU